MKKLKNISVATKKNIGYFKILVKSCKKNNIDLVLLGFGKKWEGFTMRFELWLDYLNKLEDNEIVMINDAYDVIITEDASTIINRFKKFNKKIIFGNQGGLISKFLFNSCNNYVLCCGNIIGYVKYIKKFIFILYKNKHLWEKFNNDDQMILNNICNKEIFFKKFVSVDFNNEIFFVVPDDNRYLNLNYILYGNIKNIKMKNKKIFYNNKSICVLHLPANMNGNLYLNYLGYNTKNVKLKIESYKVHQFYVLYKKLIFSIIILFLLIKKFMK